MILQSSRLLLLHNIPFIEKHFYNVQVNAMRKVFRFASLPSITSYIRYYWKQKYVYVCTHECLCVCWSHIILIHYLLHQNVNTHIDIEEENLLLQNRLWASSTPISYSLQGLFFCIFKTVSFCLTHSLSLFLSYTFWFYLPWREQIAKGLPWTIFIDACIAFLYSATLAHFLNWGKSLS